MFDRTFLGSLSSMIVGNGGGAPSPREAAAIDASFLERFDGKAWIGTSKLLPVCAAAGVLAGFFGLG